MSFTPRLAILALVASSCIFAQAGLLGEKSPDGQIRFQAIEEFQIAGTHRVRLLPLTNQRITSEEAKRLQRVELAQIGTIRADSAHRLVRVDNGGQPSDLILPDDFAPKAPVDAATAQGRLPIQAFQSRKSKTGELVSPEQFYVFISGADADRLALEFVNRASAFASLGEQLAAMEGFVASFPDSPLKAQFRDQLLNRITRGLAAFDNRGSYSDLLLLRHFANLAQRAFPGDRVLDDAAATVEKRIDFLDATRLQLQSLAAAGEWDLLLDAYAPFERYQWSFPEMIDLRQTALEESARLHSHRGALLAQRQLNSDAVRELTIATSRDPENAETAKLLESTRATASEAEAAAVTLHPPAPGSPEEQRFKFALHDAEKAIQDKEFSKAEAALADAASVEKDAPEILLLQARLLAARGRDADALPLLDRYERTVSDPAARATGASARRDILADLTRKRGDFRQQIAALQKAGDYAKLRAVAGQALTLDPDNTEFLYYGGAAAAVFHDSAAAKLRLDRYLARSNSLSASLEDRDRAFRILTLLNFPAPAAAPPAGTPNWFSGRPLADGVYYCPESGAFQLPIEAIQGYKLKMNFQWDGTRLNAIATTFDDEKGAQNYHSLGGPDSQGNFFFGYDSASPQVQVISAEKLDGPPGLTNVHVVRTAPNPPHLVGDRGLPRIVLQDSAQFNPAVLSVLEGPLATTVSGNAFFNPFIWDGLHYFSLTYDPLGRMATAREWNADNLLRFTWTGDRLTEIRAFRKDSPNPYYQRTISYSGTMLTGESYSEGTKTGQIKYVYSGKVLQQVRVEDGGVHDGKTWIARMR